MNFILCRGYKLNPSLTEVLLYGYVTVSYRWVFTFAMNTEMAAEITDSGTMKLRNAGVLKQEIKAFLGTVSRGTRKKRKAGRIHGAIRKHQSTKKYMIRSAIQARLTFQAVRDESRCGDTFWWSPQGSCRDTKATTSTCWWSLVTVIPYAQRALKEGARDVSYHHAMQTQDEQTGLSAKLFTFRSIHIKLSGYGENHFSVLCLLQSGWHNSLTYQMGFCKGKFV